MKPITINGKTYNHNDSKLLAEKSHKQRGVDLDWVEERLYETPDKQGYYLLASGGPKTKYGSDRPDGFGPGNNLLFVVTKSAAHKMAEAMTVGKHMMRLS